MYKNRTLSVGKDRNLYSLVENCQKQHHNIVSYACENEESNHDQNIVTLPDFDEFVIQFQRTSDKYSGIDLKMTNHGISKTSIFEIPSDRKELYERTISGELQSIGFDPKIDYLRKAGYLNTHSEYCSQTLDNDSVSQFDSLDVPVEVKPVLVVTDENCVQNSDLDDKFQVYSRLEVDFETNTLMTINCDKSKNIENVKTQTTSNMRKIIIPVDLTKDFHNVMTTTQFSDLITKNEKLHRFVMKKGKNSEFSHSKSKYEMNANETNICSKITSRNQIRKTKSDASIGTTKTFTGKPNIFCPDTELYQNQFETDTDSFISSTTSISSDFEYRERSIKIKKFNFCQNPFVCPIIECEKTTIGSELAKHIELFHSDILIQIIHPYMNRYDTIILDLKMNREFGIHKCHCMFLISDKIQNFGTGKYRDYIPAFLMTTKIHYNDILSGGLTQKDYLKNSFNENDQKKHLESNEDCFVIWLTSPVPKNVLINFYIKTKSKNCGTSFCSSGELYPLANSQNIRSLYKSGQAIFLSKTQYNLLTNHGSNNIKLQVKFY